MLTYEQWRDKYVVHCLIGLYVNYNSAGESSPKDAITVSEASGYASLCLSVQSYRLWLQQRLTSNTPRCRYGLLASVLADRRDDFDQFLAFYNRHENKQGLMSWQQAR